MMKPVYIKPLYQWLIGLLATALVAGGYVYFRYLPYNQKISQMQEETAGFRRRLADDAASPPSKEKINQLKSQLKALSEKAQTLQRLFEPVNRQLAPMNSQALKLKISQLARESGVYVRANVKVQGEAASSDKHQKPLLLPETESWVARMSPGTVFHRPMQRLTLEGGYHSIYAFIHGLSTLPYQVTVVKLAIRKSSSDSPPGYPQRLVADLILAL